MDNSMHDLLPEIGIMSHGVVAVPASQLAARCRLVADDAKGGGGGSKSTADLDHQMRSHS